MINEGFYRILKHEMVPALGCTDPIGIAFCAAAARKHARGEIRKIDAFFSGNLIKNVAAVIIPGSGGLCGARIATALGAVCGDADKKLEVLKGITASQVKEAVELEKSGALTVHTADSTSVLYMEIRMITEQDEVTVILQDGYTNITHIIVNGRDLFEYREDCCADESSLPYDELELDSILDFASNAHMELLEPVETGLGMNEKLACAGFERDFGAGAGKAIRDMMADGSGERNLAYSAMMWTAAGVDARMAGCELPAMSNTGSGNQGIVSTMPVLGAAKVTGASWETLVRAAAVSCLTTIYIKSSVGPLSTVCGCTIAGTGAACGMIYLRGGGKPEMISAFKNMFGNVAGIICDGAKASCALKAATCINAACMAADLALNGFGLESTNGIVGRGERDSIDYFVRTSKEGLGKMDPVILDIIMNK